MKRAELLQHTTCSACRRKLGESGLPLFWRLKVERFGINMRAVQRADGLAAFVGSAEIAAAMGPDEDLAVPLLDKPVTITLCEACAMEPVHVAVLALGGA